MSTEYYIIRKGDGPWGYVEIRFELYSGHMTATELRRNPRTEAELEGRTITIYDTAKFLRVLGIKSEMDFDRYMENLVAESKLDIDYLQRRCEYNQIRYEIAGTRLQTVWRNHIKECKAKFQQAKAFFQGDESEVDDEDDAIEYLADAADVNLPEGFGLMAQEYADSGCWSDAYDYATRGAELKDGLSMFILAKYHINWGSIDYQEAAKWCVKAAEKGIAEAVELLNRLVKEGKISADDVQFSSLLGLYARNNNSKSAGSK